MSSMRPKCASRDFLIELLNDPLIRDYLMKSGPLAVRKQVSQSLFGPTEVNSQMLPRPVNAHTFDEMQDICAEDAKTYPPQTAIYEDTY